MTNYHDYTSSLLADLFELMRAIEDLKEGQAALKAAMDALDENAGK